MTSDRLIPFYFIAFFAFITVVLTAMVMIAFHAQTGVVSKHPYEDGLAYNKVIEAAETQSALGWNGNISFKQEGEQQGKLIFKLNDISGKVIIPESVSVSVVRPSKEGMDFKLDIKPDKTGASFAELKFPMKGLWEIRVYAIHNKDTYQTSRRVVLE